MFRLELPATLPAWCRLLAVALLLAVASAGGAQTVPAKPDSTATLPAAAPADTSRTAPVGIAPDAPTAAEAPISRRGRWLIIGACALITVSTFLLYNVRSR
jgi:hypothetical protein